jgi:hypothetical protein
MSDNEDLRARAETVFKTKPHEIGKASDDYEARSRAIAEKMKRLRELRLAKEAAKSEVTKESGRTVYPGVRLNGEASRPTSTPRQTVRAHKGR